MSLSYIRLYCSILQGSYGLESQAEKFRILGGLGNVMESHEIFFYNAERSGKVMGNFKKYTATKIFQKFYSSKRINVGHQDFNIFSHFAYIVCCVSCLTPKRFFSVVVCVYMSVDTKGQGGIVLKLFSEVIYRVGLQYTFQSFLN